MWESLCVWVLKFVSYSFEDRVYPLWLLVEKYIGKVYMWHCFLLGFTLALAFLSTPYLSPLQASNASLASIIVQNINKNFESFQGIKAYLELELSQPDISHHHSFGQLAFLPKGKKLYFKTFSPLTPHYFTLIAKIGKFWLQIPKTKTIYTGLLDAIGQENFELKITPQDFQKLLEMRARW